MSYLPKQTKQRWHKEQEKRKKKTNKLVIGYWLLGICILVFVGLFFKVFQMVGGSVWDGKSKINLVLSGSNIRIASYNSKDQTLILLAVPNGTQIDVVHGYGKYRAEKITGLEKQEGRDDLLTASFQESLGLPLVGEIRTEDRGQMTENGTQKMDDGNGISEELKEAFLGERKTSLSQWDLLRLWWTIRNIRYDRIKTIDLSKINVLSQESLPDQSQVWEIDKQSLDSFLQRYFSEEGIIQENLGIEILNGTIHPGLAEEASRILDNIGGQVIWTGNSETGSQKCEVRSGKDRKGSFTIKEIQKIFDCKWQEKNGDSRGDITIILGEDYWQKLNQK